MKTCKWEWHKDDNYYDTECDEYFLFSEEVNMLKMSFYYCPNCGKPIECEGKILIEVKE